MCRQGSGLNGDQTREADAGTLRTIDAVRDDEQHWFNEVSEQLLYLHARAGVSLFDDILKAAFGESLADHLPHRVLPLSADPPRDLTLLIDEEFRQIADLLAPGRRVRHDARARIRTLLALEAHTEADVKVSTRDVNRVEKGIKDGLGREDVFPKLGDIGTEVDGEGLTLTVHFTKRAGAPVRYVGDGSAPAAAIREVDLEKRFYISPKDLAERCGLTGPRATALRRHLGIDADPKCCHIFQFASQKHPRFSDNALRSMQEAMAVLDMGDVWQPHNPSSRGAPRLTCTLEGCAG